MDLRRAQADLLVFVSMLRLDIGGRLTPWGDVLNPFQREFFEAISPALQSLLGRNVACERRRFFAEWPKGHSKSTNLAAAILWVLLASRRKLSGVGAAGDRDQARLLRDAVADLVRWNPVLEHVVEVQSYRVVNKHTGSEFDIISSDAMTSHGQRRDLIVCDELVHWQGQELWHSLLATAAKNPRCVLAVITNAGWQQSDWWSVRENIRTDPRWWFSRLDGPQADWLSPDDLAEQERHLPRVVFERLWLNHWTADDGSAALESADIDAAVTLRSEVNRPEPGWRYVVGLDIGLKRDRTGLIMLRKHVGHVEAICTAGPRYSGPTAALIDLGLLDGAPDQVEYRRHPGTNRIELAAVRCWNPREGTVSIAQVEAEIRTLHERFGLSAVAFDVWQGEYLGERLAKLGIRVVPVQFGPSVLQELASATLDAFRERQMDLYPHEGLLNDLRSLRVVERSYGYRLESPRDESGHGDVATALSLALLECKKFRADYPIAAQRRLVYN